MTPESDEPTQPADGGDGDQVAGAEGSSEAEGAQSDGVSTAAAEAGDRSRRPRWRVVAIGALLVAVVSGGAYAAVSMTGGDSTTDGGSQRTRIWRLGDSVGAAWLKFQKPDGSFDLRAPGFKRGSTNSAYLGAAMISMASRSKDPRYRRKFLRSGIKAVTHGVRYGKRDSPFPFLAVSVAYAIASKELIQRKQVQRALPEWGRYLLDHGREIDMEGHDCFVDPDCYNNWDLVRALAVVQILKSRPEGVPPPGSFLADPKDTREWLRKTLNEDVSKALGPQPETTWSLGRAGVLSDPPVNPPAYHQFSSALVTQALADAPRLFNDVGREAASRASHYSKALVAPNGDVALTGRSQLQSWTLAAVLLVASHGVGGQFDSTWRAVAERVLDRLEGREYRDRSGVFAITPSARSRKINGIDPYAIPTDYNGLTLMFLELAGRAWERGDAPGNVPTDRDGIFADLEGGHLVISKQPKVWWQWQARRLTDDFRLDAGLVQLKVKRRTRWSDMLSARPRRFDGITAGPSICKPGNRKAVAPFRVLSVEEEGPVVRMRGRFTSGGRVPGLAPQPATITMTTDGYTVTMSWPVKAGQSFCGTFPLVAGNPTKTGVGNFAVAIDLSPAADVGAGEADASASSTQTRVHRWTMTAKKSGTARIRFTAR